MKLTLAMGLQYDNGKPTNLYAMTIGQDRKKPIPVRNNPMVPVLQMPGRPPTFAYAPQHNHIFILTYNLKGLPIPFVQDSFTVSRFA